MAHVYMYRAVLKVPRDEGQIELGGTYPFPQESRSNCPVVTKSHHKFRQSRNLEEEHVLEQENSNSTHQDICTLDRHVMKLLMRGLLKN